MTWEYCQFFIKLSHIYYSYLLKRKETMCPYKYMSMNIEKLCKQSSKLETTQMTTDTYMYKQCIEYLSPGMIFTKKRMITDK